MEINELEPCTDKWMLEQRKGNWGVHSGKEEYEEMVQYKGQG